MCESVPADSSADQDPDAEQASQAIGDFISQEFELLLQLFLFLLWFVGRSGVSVICTINAVDWPRPPAGQDGRD